MNDGAKTEGNGAMFSPGVFCEGRGDARAEIDIAFCFDGRTRVFIWSFTVHRCGACVTEYACSELNLSLFVSMEGRRVFIWSFAIHRCVCGTEHAYPQLSISPLLRHPAYHMSSLHANCICSSCRSIFRNRTLVYSIHLLGVRAL
jgi:hypothetical protein